MLSNFSRMPFLTELCFSRSTKDIHYDGMAARELSALTRACFLPDIRIQSNHWQLRSRWCVEHWNSSGINCGGLMKIAALAHVSRGIMLINDDFDYIRWYWWLASLRTRASGSSLISRIGIRASKAQSLREHIIGFRKSHICKGLSVNNTKVDQVKAVCLEESAWRDQLRTKTFRIISIFSHPVPSNSLSPPRWAYSVTKFECLRQGHSIREGFKPPSVAGSIGFGWISGSGRVLPGIWVRIVAGAASRSWSPRVRSGSHRLEEGPTLTRAAWMFSTEKLSRLPYSKQSQNCHEYSKCYICSHICGKATTAHKWTRVWRCDLLKWRQCRIESIIDLFPDLWTNSPFDTVNECD